MKKQEFGRSSPALAQKPQPEGLEPGLHAAKIEFCTQEHFEVRTLSGQRLTAVLGDGVELALAQECLRQGRLIILAQTERGPTILGALQTNRGLIQEPDGTVAIEAPRVRIRAELAIEIACAEGAVRLESPGKMRLEGQRLVIDMGSNVRVLSALVELP